MDAALLLAACAPALRPTRVEQRQFDGNQGALERLVRVRPGGHAAATDLLDYALDLTYVAPLQRDLLVHVLPLCLLAWQRGLTAPAKSAFDETFLSALARRGRLIARLLGPARARATRRFMAEALLERMARETGLHFSGQAASPYVWVQNLVQYGRIWSDVRVVLRAWREMAQPGLAVCALQYLSALAYDEGDNQVFTPWTRRGGGGPPCLWEGAGVGFDERWGAANLAALRALLGRGGAARWAGAAAERLGLSGRARVSAQVAADLAARRTRVDARVADLVRFLGTPSRPAVWTWSEEAAPGAKPRGGRA